MSTAIQYRALVVDDEPLVRQATMRALNAADFVCHPASNGRIALGMAKETQYDLIVTDLRMPEANGHQFAVELLDRPNGPAIVVLTGVIEPKLSNDLRIRGVDEILFKPINYKVLAKKAREIVDERSAARPVDGNHASLSQTSAINGAAPVSKPRPSHTNEPASPAKPIVSQLANVARGLRTPPSDFDGFAQASANSFTTNDLADAIKSDPGYVDDVLNLANRILFKSHHALLEVQHGKVL